MSSTPTETQGPVLVIVPGSFGPAKHYSIFTDSLNRHGIESEVVDTPSVGKREGLQPQSMSDDVTEIVRVVSQLFDQGRQVVLLTHSYGGIPGTQSLKQLSRVSRESEGNGAGIDKIIYLASVVPPVGTCNLDLFGSNLPDFVTIEDDYMRLSPEGNAPLTFSDLPLDEALALAKEMPEHSTASFKEKLTYPGYNDVDVHYIVCEEDRIIPAEHQYGMIEFINGATGKNVVVHKLQSGHVPTISQPDNVSKIVKDILGGAV